MNIKTLMAVCLLAFSPLAMAHNHASCQCCEHEVVSHGDVKHTGKTCKAHCSDKHDKQALDHMSKMTHGAHISDHGSMHDMGMCGDAKQCHEMCEQANEPCDEKECAQCCESMHENHADH